jgi:TonB family protein
MEIKEINNSSDRLKVLLNAKPEGRTAFILNAIIISLSAHIFIFAVIYLMTSAPAMDAEETVDESIDEIELAFEEPELTPEQLEDPSNMSEEVKNLLAAAGSKRTNENVNYSGMTQAEIKAMVAENLRQEEQAEKDRLATNHKDYSVKDPAKDKQDPGKSDKNKNPDPNKTNPNGGDQSFAGAVSAEFDLAGRKPSKSPKPTYRCKSAGKVIVHIDVNQYGEVTNAWIDNASATDECIRAESLTYARKWKFDAKESAAKKQSGTITFKFTNQSGK